MKEFICEHGVSTVSDLQVLAEKYLHGGCSVYAVYTNHFYCGTELNIDAKHLLELRIFSDDEEFKISRLNIGSDFTWRYINDSEYQKKLENESDDFLSVFDNQIYDEEHYLDVDSTNSKGCCYITTGGGPYTLPVGNAEKVHIRNYLDYDEHGIVMISDFRIVGFIKKGDNIDGEMD